MTAAKSLQRKDVDRVAAGLLGALKAECPDYSEFLFLDPPSIPRPESKRARAIWEAYRLAWSASARFSRREQIKRAKTLAQGEAFFDDKRINQAIVSLERARTLVRNANRALLENVERIEKEAVRLGLGTDLQDHPDHVRSTKRIGDALDSLVNKLKSFRGISQPRTQSEWDEFISSTAERLLAVGFGSREVAGLLTGRKPEKVDRATLERFRQRVRRLQISEG
jgi:hypothetical protein